MLNRIWKIFKNMLRNAAIEELLTFPDYHSNHEMFEPIESNDHKELVSTSKGAKRSLMPDIHYLRKSKYRRHESRPSLQRWKNTSISNIFSSKQPPSFFRDANLPLSTRHVIIETVHWCFTKVQFYFFSN